MIRYGDTTIVCGIRAETLLASDAPNFRFSNTQTSASNTEARDLDLLVPNIELATGCAPAYLPGMPPTALAQSLSTRIYSILHASRMIDAEELRIYGDVDLDGNREVKGFWVLYIDILYISLDGNAFDGAWAAVVSALRDVRLPGARWNADVEGIVCSGDIADSKRLGLRGLPIASTFAVFGGDGSSGDKYWVLADPDSFEEGLCREFVTVVVDHSTGNGKGPKILGISKSGGGVLGKEEMAKVLELGAKRWIEWKEVMGA